MEKTGTLKNTASFFSAKKKEDTDMTFQEFFEKAKEKLMQADVVTFMRTSPTKLISQARQPEPSM